MCWKTSETTIADHEHFEANAREKGRTWDFTYERVVENNMFGILNCNNVHPLAYALLDMNLF